MPGLFDILNAWCSIQLTDCLTSLVLSILPNYCIFHKGFVNDFWIQKLHHFYDFRIQIFVGPFSQFLAPETSVFCGVWIQKLHHVYNFQIQKYFGPFSGFLDSETAVFLHFPDPESAPFLQFLDCHSMTRFMGAGRNRQLLIVDDRHHPHITRLHPTCGPHDPHLVRWTFPRSFPLELTMGRPSLSLAQVRVWRALLPYDPCMKVLNIEAPTTWLILHL